MTDDGWQHNSSLVESLLSGFVEKKDDVDPQYEPMLIANHDGRTMEYAIKDELGRSQNFDMSVAFVSQGALQTLKQNFLDFADSNDHRSGRIRLRLQMKCAHPPTITTSAPLCLPRSSAIC